MTFGGWHFHKFGLSSQNGHQPHSKIRKTMLDLRAMAMTRRSTIFIIILIVVLLNAMNSRQNQALSDFARVVSERRQGACEDASNASTKIVPHSSSSKVILRGASAVERKMLQARVQKEVDKFLRKLKSSENKTRIRRSLLPPHTPGAVIHIGKTGGSSLTHILEHSCHSFIRKPCPGFQEKTKRTSVLSKTATYVHVPDFRLLNQTKSGYTNFFFYTVTSRDPFQRAPSAYTFEHPRNSPKFKRNKRVYSCFPTLERMTELLGDNPTDYHNEENPDSDTRASSIPPDKCANLTRAVLDGQHELPDHFYFGYRKVLEEFSLQYRQGMDVGGVNETRSVPGALDDAKERNTIPPLVILTIRNEHLWDDYVGVHYWLSGTSPNETRRQTDAPYVPFSTERKQETFVVDKSISSLGRTRLCRALQSEYEAYLELLRRSINLSQEEKNESLEISRKSCPDLEILKTVEFA